MFKVQFGKTGQEVSHIGLGGGQYIYDTNAEKSRIVDVIQYAYGKFLLLLKSINRFFLFN